MAKQSKQRAEDILENFYREVSEKLNTIVAGEPEDQLRGPFETLVKNFGQLLGKSVVATGETRLKERIGQPDYAITIDGLLCGYVELKAPGKGANAEKYKSHDSIQWEKFKAIPNILYCDGSEWKIYRSGEEVNKTLKLPPLPLRKKIKFEEKDIDSLVQLLSIFLSWNPIPPETPRQLAEEVAPLCGLLREEVLEALNDSNSPLLLLAKDWRDLLFPEANNDQFADAYAQTITFALLLARANNANVLSIEETEKKIGAQNTLLAKALQVLTDKAVVIEIKPALTLLQRYIAAVDPIAFRQGDGDPWLYFYEDFLSQYDPELRKKSGAYYTPVEVVRAQVNLVGSLLINKFGKRYSFAEENVTTLDPAVGTGTYLLGVIEYALSKVRQEEGPGAVSGRASILLKNLKGFENMAGPYAVAELRLTQAFLKNDAEFSESLGICFTDTLESPYTKPKVMGLFYKDLAQEHKRALKIKDEIPVLVCLGNPPYLRTEASDDTNHATTGGWVRYGNSDRDNLQENILSDFITPVKEAGRGGQLKNLYNLYVYFWRWAIWKVFEHTDQVSPGIVTFITASSYLQGDAFLGMREHLRKVCDEIWIIDLGGEGRGTRKDDNVFEVVQTPVAIAIAVRYKSTAPLSNGIAKVNYSRIKGTREEKLLALDRLKEFSDLKWEECDNSLHAPFIPKQTGKFSEWPLLIRIMPWQYSGVQAKRVWPIAPDISTLQTRWRVLLEAQNRASIFQDKTTDRNIEHPYKDIFNEKKRLPPISTLPKDTPPSRIFPYGYRSFDTQYIIADGRLISRPRSPLWNCWSENQLYFTSLLSHPLGSGPAISVTKFVPDLHHFRGSYGGKDVLPLWYDRSASHPNILPGLMDLLESEFNFKILALDVVGYIYGILSNPSYTDGFKQELEATDIRVPFTRDSQLFREVSNLGKKLITIHTSIEEGKNITPGRARCTVAVPSEPENYPKTFTYDGVNKTLTIGNGKFEFISEEVWSFEVSGLRVVSSWLGYRMSESQGRSSSPLDGIHPERWTSDFTSKLLRLLWCIEATIDMYGEQKKYLDAVLAGELFSEQDFPLPPSITYPPTDNEEEATLF